MYKKPKSRRYEEQLLYSKPRNKKPYSRKGRNTAA